MATRIREMAIDNGNTIGLKRTRAHDRAHLGFDRTQKRRVVHLPAGALVHDLIPARSIGLLVVVHIMLRVGDHAFRLYPTDDGLHQLIAEIWIFP